MSDWIGDNAIIELAAKVSNMETQIANIRSISSCIDNYEILHSLDE